MYVGLAQMFSVKVQVIHFKYAQGFWTGQADTSKKVYSAF